MPRTLALAFFTFCLSGGAASQSLLLVGRLVDVSRRPPAPVSRAKVKVLYTRQEAVTKTDGLFQFTLPPAMVPGSEVQIEVEAGNLRVYLPRNGMLTVPAPGAKLVEVQLLPAGSKLFLEPAAIEALLTEISKPPLNPERTDSGRSAKREPRVQRFLRQWAADYGFSLEDVEREVKAWGDQIRGKREDASVRQRGLAEFQAQHFDRAAALFQESASAEATVLDRIDAERKERERAERPVLQGFLDDNIRAAEALTQSLKYEEAARVLLGAANRVSRERYALWWAEMQVRWGLALLDMGASGEATQSIASLRAAVTACENALQVYTRESDPQAWAATQNALGLAHQSLGERLSGTEGLESMLASVTAYQNALQVYTKESDPQGWAVTQDGLGTTYLSLGERQSGTEGVESMHASVTAYQNALQVFTKESDPRGWAVTQDGLGGAYLSVGERQNGTEGAESLHASVIAYQNALRVFTKESFPRAWATTQNDLGLAYQRLGERQSGSEWAESLLAAFTAFQNALRVFTRESLPQDWARTQNNLGDTYLSYGERQSGTGGVESLLAAVTAYRNALQVATRESLPQAWAGIQNNLGLTYLRLGERQSGTKGALESLHASLIAYQNALQVDTRESLPQAWAETQNNLGGAYQRLGERLSGTEGVESLLAAVTAYQNALQVRTKESLPQAWAMTQNNLGDA